MSRGDTSYRCTHRRLSGDEESMMIAKSIGGGVAKFRAAAATLLAAAMLVTSAGSLAFSNNKLAYAADLNDGALCTPTIQSMGTEANPATERDSGVATWVGGDMYVGKKSDNLTNDKGPDSSYSVEAEGLTVVNGKLMLHPQKNSWESKGFRFGIAGFGTQYRPAEGSTALVVGGNSNTEMDSGTSTADVKAWDRPGFIDGHSHIGSLAGSQSDVWDRDGTSSISSYNGASVNWQKDKSGTVKNQDAGNLAKVLVRATDNGTATDKNFSKDKFYQGYVLGDISNPLAKQNATGTVSSSISTLAELTRHKYNFYGSNISYTFEYDDTAKHGTDRGIASATSYTNREKLITFTGTNNASMEVFNLDASMLSDTDADGKLYRGVGFAFTNIADTASVVINVTGNASNISFHNGWQFWWNDKEISDGYSNFNNTDELKKKSAAYDKAAQKILWNFSNTDNLTIYGGVANEDGTNTNNDKITQDDAAAAMMGSIIVKGNFESHVTTNGRVYTGGDFSMHNPYKAWTFHQAGANDGESASVLDMDQERHNFPWNGSYTESCSAIAWQKADESGTLLGGTTWAVYGKYDDAANGTHALLTVQDNAFYDKDSDDGQFTVEGLKPKATYYIKEVSAGSDYQLNTNIYYVATGESSTTPVSVEHSATKNTDGTIDTTGTAGMTDGKIVNKKNGHEVSWSKVDADTNEELAGSKWQIQQVKDESGAGVSGKSWNVADNTSEATGVTVTPTSTTLDSTNEWKTDDLIAAVKPEGALQEVTWTFTDEDGKAVGSSTAAVLTRTGNLKTTVTGISSTDTTVYVKACSVSNPKVCSTPVAITVKAMSVKDFSVKDSSNQNVESDSIITAAAVGSTLTFTASSTPAVPITWESSNASVATVTSSGDNNQKATVMMQGFGSAVITAKAGGQTISFTVKVPSTTVYFKKSLRSDWSKYYVYYNDGNKNWKFVEMSQSCGDYVYAILPKQSHGTNFLFHGDDENTSTSKWYKSSNESDFEFTGNDVQVVNKHDDPSGSTAPAGCPASAAAAAVRSNDAAVLNENAVVTPADDPQPRDTDGVAENAVDDGAKAISCTAADGENGNPGVKCDTDTAAGKFKVGGLDAGTYWLHEITAPDGYTINKTLYQFTIDANGNVTWNGGWASGEAIGAIDEKLKPGDNNAISDTPTEVTWNKVDAKDGKLAGSQWRIVGPSPTDVYCVADNVTVDTNGDTTPAGTEFADCTGEKLSDAANTADEAGVITVRGLPVGTYTLTETKAPDGYVATTTVYTLTISDTEASTVVAQTATDRPTTRSGGNREAAANVPNASAPVNIQIPVKKSVKYTSWPKDSNGNYVNFNFKIEATKSTVDANPAAPMPAECSSSDATKNDCTISLAPKSDADDLSNVIAKFGKMTFTDANLAAAAGDASDYAKTYTYKIAEIVPDSADAVENLRYSKAEYQVVVTLKQAKDSSGKLSGLSVSATMTRIKDDSGNAEAGGGKMIGTWSSTSTGSSAGTAVEATFVNTKVLTGLPTTGADWTGRLVLLVGDGFILAGVLIAGGYQLAKRRREEDSD